MVKTKRRNIKKRNTRCKKSKTSLKNKTKYTNNKKKYKNTNRKTRYCRNRRGGGVTFVRIDEKTGNHIYYSDMLDEHIEIAPLSGVSTKKAYDSKQHDQQILAKMAIAGIKDFEGKAPADVVDRYVVRHNVQGMPKIQDIPVPEQAVKAKNDEKDKKYTMSMADKEEKRRIGKLEDAMFETSSFLSATKKKPPAYLDFTEEDFGISPTRVRPPVVSSLAKSPRFKSMHLSSAKGKEQPRQSLSSGSEDDIDLGGEEADDIAILRHQLELDQKYIKEHGVPPPPPRRLKQSQGAVAHGRPRSPDKQLKPSLFQALRTKVTQLVSDDIDRRLREVYRRLYTDSDTQKMIRDCPPCLQHYILFRLEGQGITKGMITKLIDELKDGKGPQLRFILGKHNLLPIPETLWVPDGVCERSAIPHDRGEEFGVFKRRHHCRCCGRCVTAKYIESGTNPSVCTECAKIFRM